MNDPRTWMQTQESVRPSVDGHGCVDLRLWIVGWETKRTRPSTRSLRELGSILTGVSLCGRSERSAPRVEIFHDFNNYYGSNNRPCVQEEF
jgi:hypothetical protein